MANPSTNAVIPLPCLTLLDAVQHLHELERFDAAQFLSALASELGPADQTVAHLAAQVDGLHQVLQSIDQFTSKAMAIHLTHLFSREPVPPQLRTLISTTIVGYADDLGLFRRRFDRSMSPALLDSIVETAAQILSVRTTLRRGVLAIGQRHAQAQLAWLEQAARNRTLADNERLRLRLARMDLQQVSERPERLAQERFEARLKSLPPPSEEAMQVEARSEDPEAERFALLEID